MATDTFNQALKLAAEVRHPIGYATVGLIVAFWLYLGVGRISASKTKRWQVFVCALAIVLVSATPAVLQGIAWFSGVFHLRVIVLGPDGVPRPNAHVVSSVGGEPKQVSGGAEFDIPPQTLPQDGLITIFASLDSEFLHGAKSTNVKNSNSFYQTLIVKLTADTSAKVAGIVVDRHGRAVSGAIVSIVGQHETTTTSDTGYFSLEAHAAAGQIVNLHAQKGNLVSAVEEPAGASSIQIQLPLVR